MRNDARLPARLSHVVTEAHRRGIKVVGGFRPVGSQRGDRSEFPCYCREADVQKVLGHFRQYLEAGCDFLYFMADDYYSDKLAGHCPECIARFGSLAGEQQYMLRQIVELAQKHGMSSRHILFCPTHYDVDAGKNYLEVFDEDPKLRDVQFTFTYTQEDMIERRKKEYPHVRYALFYNGPRWLAYYSRGLPPRAAEVLQKSARNAMYYPIYYGWHAAQYDPRAGWFVGATDQVKREFHVVIPRETAQSTLLGNIANYSDSIFAGPVEYALWGHYCWNPIAYDTKQSEAVIAESLFGPGGGRTLAPLNRLLLDLTRLVYPGPLPDAFMANLTERLEFARTLQRRLKDGYEAYARQVGPAYIPKTRDFYARLGLDDIENYVSVLSEIAQKRTRQGSAELLGPQARYAGVLFPSPGGDGIVLSGGCLGDLTHCLNDRWRYSIADARWERLEVPPGWMSPRCGHSAVPFGDRVLFFGGTERGFENVCNTLHVYEGKTGQSQLVDGAQGGPLPPRLLHAACGDDRRRMWIFGGLTTGRKDLGDLWCYVLDKKIWEQVKVAGNDSPGPRYGCRMVFAAGSLYLFGGRTASGQIFGDLYRFDIDACQWHRLLHSAGEVPTPRYSPAMLAVGKLVYLFGGGGPTNRLGDAYIYAPAVDRWQKLAPKGAALAPRLCPLAVASDERRIFLYGGAQPADAFGSWINGELFSYDLAGNSFTRLYAPPDW